MTVGIYGLKALGPFRRLAHGIPCLRLRGVDQHTKFDRAADDSAFLERLTKFAPFLTGFDWKRHGLCLAGGAVSALVMRDLTAVTPFELARFGPHDFDVFLVGHRSENDARKAIQALGRHLAKVWQEKGGRSAMHVYRTQTCITFCDPNMLHGSPGDGSAPRLVQVILRLYSTKGEVIHGFDLGSSAMLWDGESVSLTGMGRLAAEHGANVLSLAVRRRSYESRLCRYFHRGFDIVLPNLDVCALMGGEHLPYLKVYMPAASRQL